MSTVPFEKQRVGARAFTHFPLWLTVLLWTFFFSEGAGFGAATYRTECDWTPPRYHCRLVRHEVLPPAVSAAVFAENLVTLWFDGLYDAGFQFALIALIALFLATSRMTWHLAARVFSLPVIAAGCAIFSVVGYYYEIHQTLSTGYSSVPLL